MKWILTFPSFTLFWVTVTAFADLGSVSDFDEADFEEETIQTSQSSQTTASKTVEVERKYTIAQPWLLETTAGYTAFTLDKNEWLMGSPLRTQMFGVENIHLPMEIKYGLVDWLTLGVGMELNFKSPSRGRFVNFEAHWNIANTETWSFGLIPHYGFHMGKDHRASEYSDEWQQTRSDKELGVGLVASKVITDSSKLHFGAYYGRYTNTVDTQDSYTSYTYDEDWNETGTFEQQANYHSVDARAIYRIDATWEYRANRNHGVSFSLIPQYRAYNDTYTSEYKFEDDWEDYDYDYNTTEYGLAIGAGYYYLRDVFGFRVGWEMGPSMKSEEDWWNDGKRANFKAIGLLSGTLAVDFRF